MIKQLMIAGILYTAPQQYFNGEEYNPLSMKYSKVDIDHNGRAESMGVHYDFNQNKVADTYALFRIIKENSGNVSIEKYAYYVGRDWDEDGELDAHLFDTNNDGGLDSLVITNAKK